MRILFTGGGTGGHFYPIIAVAEEIKKLIKEKRLIEPELFYMAPTPYNESVLFEQGIEYRKVPAGKARKYFSILNFLDLWTTGLGIITALYKVYRLYPDVIFGKGGYASFPVLFAAKILRIPVVIHESDAVPGRVNKWASKFATRIAVSWSEAAKYFPSDKVAHTGNPIRNEVRERKVEGAREFLQIDEGVPVVLVLGGSQGAEVINEVVIEALPDLVKEFAVIHQTGKSNLTSVKTTADVILHNSPHKDRFKPYAYLNSLELRMAAGAADVVVSRAGSTIFEIAAWHLPSIIIPISEKVSHDQRTNAFAYARAGACEVIEEGNFTSHILGAEIERIITSADLRAKMIAATIAFDIPNAAKKVAEEVIKIALSHEIQN
ncbi:MAG: UDP-N-acetylglucosamine--N-acetylmuramyl-(pentapeptide) pyrophosphoryl-undecaprenol N-acetylglucosamine transferase [Patescibacteria group bacterium]